MNYIILDLEMNPIHRHHKAERRICRSEVIEIGAVGIDEYGNEKGYFKSYVMPQLNNEIQHKIQDLTGISTEMVQGAPVFATAIRRFFKWCSSFGEFQIVQWSTADYCQISQEMKLKGYTPDDAETSCLDGWIDLQEELGNTIGLSRAVALDMALCLAGIDFSGRHHDALDDARNTGILLNMIRRPNEFRSALEKVALYLKPKSQGICLGDMFDFEQLQLSA